MKKKSNLKPTSSSSSNRERFFERLSQTDTYASRGLKEKVNKSEEDENLLFDIEFGPDLRKDRFFDRLSQTETYASRRLKEKANKPKEEGRPLFHIEIQPHHQKIHEVRTHLISGNKQKQSSNQTLSTCSSSICSGRTSRSSAHSRGNGSVFDRLANTGTKSSLRRNKQLECYAEKENTFAESMKKFHYRDERRGSITSVIRRNSKWDDGIERISFYPNREEAEI